MVDMPPSTYRPSPPSSRTRGMPPDALEPDRQLVEGFAPPKPQPTLRSKPEPPKEGSKVAAKKKRSRVKATPELRASSLAKLDKLLAAGTPASEAVATVAKEVGSSASVIYRWRKEVKSRAGESNGAAPAPKLSGLDLILDILELCDRAKQGLTKSQRTRLRATLNERLS